MHDPAEFVRTEGEKTEFLNKQLENAFLATVCQKDKKYLLYENHILISELQFE